jgi:glycosyltransferase involved in cell wall biosynthesis
LANPENLKDYVILDDQLKETTQIFGSGDDSFDLSKNSRQMGMGKISLKKYLSENFTEKPDLVSVNYQTNEYPLVSVIIPAYNAEQYIGFTLKSLIRQSYPHLEIIVVDDGSSDLTAQIVKKSILKDNRIKLVRQPNFGVAAARNLAIRQSIGSFIAPVDADDICFPDKIVKLLGCLLKAEKKTGLAYSWSVSIDPYGNLISKGQMSELEGEVFEYLLFSNFIGNASAVLIRKSCFDAVGLYNTAFFSQKAQGCEDYDLYLRIAEKFQFKLVGEFLTGYRKTGHAMSDNYKSMDKSRQLVFRDQKRRNPWIPDVVINWTSAYYSLWLSSLAAKKGCYYDSIVYLLRAAQYDPFLLKNTEYLRFFVRRLKGGVKKMLLPSCKYSSRKVHLLNAQRPIMSKKSISANDFENIPGFKTKKSSLDLLKERRCKIAHKLITQARIKNGHLVR